MGISGQQASGQRYPPLSGVAATGISDSAAPRSRRPLPGRVSGPAHGLQCGTQAACHVGPLSPRPVLAPQDGGWEPRQTWSGRSGREKAAGASSSRA
jgi:hypothetical protein